MQTPSYACTRERSPSTTLTLTITVSPGPNFGISLPADNFSNCSFSSCWMRFMVDSPSAARPSRGMRAGCASIGLSCADLAPVYGKGRALSPFRGVFWRFLAAVFGHPEVRPPRPRQGFRLGQPPGGDLGVVAGVEDFRDRLAFELLRAGILRVFQ